MYRPPPGPNGCPIDLGIGPCHVQTGAKRFGPNVDKVVRVRGSRHQLYMPIELCEYSQSVPLLQTRRLNVTALSQKYNLYFAAYGATIYIYRPLTSRQLISGSVPDGKIHLPWHTISGPHNNGHYDHQHPHHVNNLAVGFLGEDEILVAVGDNGDVSAFYTRPLAERVHSQRAGHAPPAPCSNATLFVDNVFGSAWGVAIHAKSRLIAVSCNTLQITVFALGLESCNEPRVDDAHSVEAVVRRRDRNWRIVINLPIAARNSPSVSFLEDERGNANWVCCIDIENKVWIADIWAPDTEMKAYHVPVASERLISGWDSSIGWGVLPLKNTDFMDLTSWLSGVRDPLPQSADFDFTRSLLLIPGVPGHIYNARLLHGPLRLREEDDEKNDFWKGLIGHMGPPYVGSAMDIQRWKMPRRGSPTATVEEFQPGPPTPLDVGLLPQPSSPTAQSHSQASDSTTAGDPAPSPESFDIILPGNGDTPGDGDGDPYGEGEFPENLLLRLAFDPRCDAGKKAVDLTQMGPTEKLGLVYMPQCHAIWWQPPKGILFCSAPDDVTSNDCVASWSDITWHRSDLWSSRSFYVLDPMCTKEYREGRVPGYSRLEERTYVVAHIPQLQLVAIGSGLGRVTLLTPVRWQQQKEDGSEPEWRYSFRIEAVLPFGWDEDAGRKPNHPLFGVAVGPVQRPGQPQTLDLGGNPHEKPAYRLMMHYQNFTILTYELRRGGMEGLEILERDLDGDLEEESRRRRPGWQPSAS